MKKMIQCGCLFIVALLGSLVVAKAQIPFTGIITGTIKRVIKAMDLQVQRLQNKTIWLQNAQKTVENTMSKMQLDEIANWVKKHKEQYQKYFDELHNVKSVISGYNQVKLIMQKQVRIISEYKRMFALFKRDKHFTPSEIVYMGEVYNGIVDASLKNIDQLYLVVKVFSTDMTDGQRLEIINAVAGHIDDNLNDLIEFNSENAKLSLQRSKDAREVSLVKTMYGL